MGALLRSPSSSTAIVVGILAGTALASANAFSLDEFAPPHILELGAYLLVPVGRINPGALASDSVLFRGRDGLPLMIYSPLFSSTGPQPVR